MSVTYYAGLDIGGTKCACILGSDEDGVLTILRREAIPTDKSVPAAVMLERLDALLSPMLASVPVRAIGVSCGGPLDSVRGLIQSPPNLPGWDDVAVCEFFSSRHGVPCHLQNDANACALAEWKYGAGRGLKNVVFLTFGTGMGAGLILNGSLYSGACDLAGEVGHVRLNAEGPVGYGKAGSFEGYCSGGGIVNLARLLMERDHRRTVLEDDDTLTAKSISEAAAAGDALARDVYAISARRLGQGIAVLIDILNPEAVVIGSIYARDTALFYEGMRETIEAEALPAAAAACKIVPAELGESLGDIAALSLVME